MIDGDKKEVVTVDAPISTANDVETERTLDRVARRTRNAAQDLLDDAGMLPSDHNDHLTAQQKDALAQGAHSSRNDEDAK
jgi:hypothetical protein